MAISFYKWLIAVYMSVGMGFFITTNYQKSLSVVAHPFYISITELNHNNTEKLMETTIKVFTDDLENTLKKQYRITNIELAKAANAKQANELVSDYFIKRLALKLDGKPQLLEYVGFEIEDASLLAYFQVSGVDAVKKIEVRNTILYEAQPTQIGIVHAIVNKQKKSTRLTNPEANAVFEF
jgi:hypothetical protein